MIRGNEMLVVGRRRSRRRRNGKPLELNGFGKLNIGRRGSFSFVD